MLNKGQDPLHSHRGYHASLLSPLCNCSLRWDTDLGRRQKWAVLCPCPHSLKILLGETAQGVNSAETQQGYFHKKTQYFFFFFSDAVNLPLYAGAMGFQRPPCREALWKTLTKPPLPHFSFLLESGYHYADHSGLEHQSFTQLLPSGNKNPTIGTCKQINRPGDKYLRLLTPLSWVFAKACIQHHIPYYRREKTEKDWVLFKKETKS